MKFLLPVLGLVALAGPAGAQVGKSGEIDVKQWLNTPPIGAKALEGHAVLVEVFRTW
jgi:hypothetical protein